ncbi:MAG TPA: FAD-dependent oxidoreductase [Candidatus Saccharimonadales bacterium]|nr:FAD-dependent oxidoreductase [Candidatus Saccharimonadales bacterium]
MALTLIEKQHLVDNIWTFRFKPDGIFTWTAGQFVRVELPHENPDGEGTKRWFTNAAAPFEGVMQITTRITDTTFKQALSKLEPGDTLQLVEKPDGDFTWQDSDLPIVFVAGGIGITPFHSILKQRAHDGLPLNVTLIYGSRTPDVPFTGEIAAWQALNPDLKVQYVAGEPLTAASLAKMVPNLHSSLVYVSGPEPMVEALANDLKSQGQPEAQIKRDEFPNYNQTNY